MDVLGNPELLNDVIRRTNTQNPMKMMNLCAHDQWQINIARLLDRYHIFYERREREWKNEKMAMMNDYVPVDMKSVAQWLSTRDEAIGLGRARSRTSQLFQGKLYKRLFSGFDERLRGRQYDDLVLTVWAGLFVRTALRRIARTWRPYGRIARLALVKAVLTTIEVDPRLRSGVPRLLGEHRFGSKTFPRGVGPLFTDLVRRFAKFQRESQRREANLDFTNFFKRDDLTTRAYQRVISTQVHRRLGRLLRAARHLA